MYPPDPFDGAIAWIVSVMLGETATAVAVIAVAGMGFAMLQGRQSARDGIRVFLGCVILFNAPAIAAAFNSPSAEPAAPADLPPPVPHPPIAVRPYAPAPYDPYAGARFRSSIAGIHATPYRHATQQSAVRGDCQHPSNTLPATRKLP